MPRYRMIMLSQAQAGREEEFERWYDETHIPEMLQVPGFLAAQRFRTAMNVVGKTPYPFCTIYELEADSAKAAAGAMFGAMQRGQVTTSDLLDPANGQGFLCEEVRERVTRA